MTKFLLIRHAHVEAVGSGLAGRQNGHRLSAQGRREANRLAEWLSEERIDHIYSSPLERAMETAATLARSRTIEVKTAEAINEFHFGAWAGRSFADLQHDPLWQTFNSFRSNTRPPGGETMLEVQARAVTFLQQLHEGAPQDTMAIISHCDVIRAALCHFLGMPLDFYHRLTIQPASVSIVAVDTGGSIVFGINTTLPEKNRFEAGP